MCVCLCDRSQNFVTNVVIEANYYKFKMVKRAVSGCLLGVPGLDECSPDSDSLWNWLVSE